MLVYFAIMLTALIGFCGLAVDVGRMELRTLQLQSAADAGALTGAAEWGNGNNSWLTAATTDVTAVDTLNGISGVTITGQNGASSGSYTTDYSTVQIGIKQQVRTLFLGILSSGNMYMTVSVKAVAAPPPCMYFSGTGQALYLASAGMNSSCVVYSKNAIAVDYFAHIYSPGVKVSGAAGASYASGSISNAPFYGAPVLADPLAYVTAPTLSTCTYFVTLYIIGPVLPLNPGTYCGGLSINGASVTMNPGLYIFTGGITLTNATLTGSGVTMYLTKGGVYGYGQFLANNSTIHVNAPTATYGGNIPGIVLFLDRNWGGTTGINLNSSVYQSDGIIYAIGSGVSEQGTNMKGYYYFSVVAQSMYIYAGTNTPSNNYYAVTGGNPLHNYPSLVQ